MTLDWLPQCPKCDSKNTYCTYVDEDGLHHRYCGECEFEWKASE